MTVCELTASVGAAVEKGSGFSIAAAHQQHGYTGYLQGLVIARLGEFAAGGKHEGYTPEKLGELLLETDVVRVERGVNAGDFRCQLDGVAVQTIEHVTGGLHQCLTRLF